jgi:hypothetical protein
LRVVIFLRIISLSTLSLRAAETLKSPTRMLFRQVPEIKIIPLKGTAAWLVGELVYS